ncbi:YggT family protein [Loigolactobacillus zhaoyuanensis]|uniref:YggT family protein n=1 Tax=Loigolactobacillus zhaoyuanensis TaxID=2486017 RepID=A0ABW8UF54_9LACO|nr:YggT family protein [Loigolactobacillus zhaoyuanensis]
MLALVSGIFYLLNRLIDIYMFILVIYVLMSWFPNAYQTKLGQLLGRLSEPYLNIFYRFVPPIAGLSFAPMIALLVLGMAQYGVAALAQLILPALI